MIRNKNDVVELCRVFTSRLNSLGYELDCYAENVAYIKKTSTWEIVGETNGSLEDMHWFDDDKSYNESLPTEKKEQIEKIN